MFLLLAFLVEFYFGKKTLSAIKQKFPNVSPKRLKTTTWFLIIFLNIYPVFLVTVWIYASFSHTNVLVPQNKYFDYLILFPFWISILIATQCDLIFLIIDFLKLPLFPVYKKFKEKYLRIQKTVVFVVIIFFVFYVPIRIVYDHFIIDVTQIKYVKENLPAELNNFKLVFISDIQADRYTTKAKLRKYISLVNEQNPDLVLIGGDVITSTPNYIEEAARYLGAIKSKYGVYSCVGDHDNWAYHNNYSKSLHDVTQALNKYDVKMINNDHRVIMLDSAKILISFLTNTYVEHTSKTETDSISNVRGTYGLKILLTHQPNINSLKAAEKFNYNLFLAGHTHGGQITFLFPFINLTPTLLETKYVKGEFHFGKLFAIVTRGLGVSLVPLRYNSTPEISVINITR